MIIETALPTTTEVVPASDQANAEALDTTTESAGTEAATEGEQPPKKEKTPEEREIARLRRGIDRKTRQLAEARAAANTQQVAVTREQDSRTTSAAQADDEPITLSRAELAKQIKQEAERLAPTIRSQQAEVEHRSKVVEGLAKEWGSEKFDAMASDLDDVFGGLAGPGGKPKPATDAIFESEMPKALIEYLTDPDNAEEAEALANANDRQAGRIVAKLEIKLAAAKPDKPQRSSAGAPLEPIKGGGKTTSSMPDPADTKAYMKWANEQERGRR